ncbi:MAG: aryl-sulfate sulfotransferase [Ignavibacteria bacterium]|nr:aryl-sulfate sulfotransferase [Ignavibacteria bacterium]
MRYYFILIILIFCTSILFANPKGIEYLEPKQGAKYVNLETSIIIRPESKYMKLINLSSFDIQVTGTKSGKHTGELIYSDDGTTIIYKSDKLFSLAETVKVVFKIPTLKKIEYEFYTKVKEPPYKKFDSFKKEIEEASRELSFNMMFNQTDSLPNNYPAITVEQFGQTAPGKIFLANFSYPGICAAYMSILPNSNTPFFYRYSPNNIYDFKVQKTNGKITYCDYIKHKFYMLDTSYVIIDSFYTGNGYTTDEHDLQILANGHYLILSYDPQIINMSEIFPGGDTAAVVIGLIVQELDANKNVVFQWRSWDYFSILDATNINFTAGEIDYVHGNAVEKDIDGNLMISSRNMDEITKISRLNGNIIWRLGGKKNQFTFINDTLGFNRQHDIRRVYNGNITLYDNGNFHSPPFSRAIEYQINETAKTVTLVWEYRHNPRIYAPAMGNVQRLPNGNTVIGWGFTNNAFTEVTPQGTKVMHVKFPLFVSTYRAFRFPWKEDIPTIFPNPTNKLPEKYSLYQNYPNPFNPTTLISFDIPKLEFVKLRIFDIIGREIALLINENLKPGNYKIEFNGSNLPSGTYFYSLETQSFREVKRMTLVK